MGGESSFLEEFTSKSTDKSELVPGPGHCGKELGFYIGTKLRSPDVSPVMGVRGVDKGKRKQQSQKGQQTSAPRNRVQGCLAELQCEPHAKF